MAETKEKKFSLELCTNLFMTGIVNGVNFQFFFKALKNQKLLIVLFLHLAVMLGIMGGVFVYISFHVNGIKQYFLEDPGLIVSLISKISPNLVFLGFVFWPWLGFCYIISGQFGGFMTKLLRADSEVLNRTQQYYQPKPLSTPGQNILRVLIKFGLKLVPFVGIMAQNMALPMIPIPILGRLAGFVSNLIYFAYNVFSLHWMSASLNPSVSKSFPSSYEILDRFRFVERNWAYFIGFVFPTILTSYFIIPTFVAPIFPAEVGMFLSPLFFTTAQVFSMIVSWPVCERYELAALKKNDGEAAQTEEADSGEVNSSGYFQTVGPDVPLFTKDGPLPSVPFLSYIPTKFTQIMDSIFAEKDSEGNISSGVEKNDINGTD